MALLNRKEVPKLAATQELAAEGITIGFETDRARVNAHLTALGFTDRTLSYHRDPILSVGAASFYIVAVYTNRRDRRTYITYGRLRLSPRNRMMDTVARRPLEPGERVAFVWQVQKSIDPQVAHFSFSETTSGLDDVGQRVTLHVPPQFLAGMHSRNLTPVSSGLRAHEGVIQSERQPAHTQAPAQGVQATEPKTTRLTPGAALQRIADRVKHHGR